MDVIKQDDWLFVQMGHNDASKDKPERYTEPYTTYKQYLKCTLTARVKRGIAASHHTCRKAPLQRRRLFKRFPGLLHCDEAGRKRRNVRLIDLMDKSLQHLRKRIQRSI
ncbi:hypothetical protein PO124_20195 [Bacillus licheniformis]|nr:hypothetical protein [Bacillus licheniformis]